MDAENKVIITGAVVFILIGIAIIGAFTYAKDKNLAWSEYAGMGYGWGSAFIIIFGIVLIWQLVKVYTKSRARPQFRLATTW